MGSGNRFQWVNSDSLFSLAGRYDNPIPPRFLAPIACLKIPALDKRKSENSLLVCCSFCVWLYCFVNKVLDSLAPERKHDLFLVIFGSHSSSSPAKSTCLLAYPLVINPLYAGSEPSTVYGIICSNFNAISSQAGTIHRIKSALHVCYYGWRKIKYSIMVMLDWASENILLYFRNITTSTFFYERQQRRISAEFSFIITVYCHILWGMCFIRGTEIFLLEELPDIFISRRKYIPDER